MKKGHVGFSRSAGFGEGGSIIVKQGGGEILRVARRNGGFVRLPGPFPFPGLKESLRLFHGVGRDGRRRIGACTRIRRRFGAA